VSSEALACSPASQLRIQAGATWREWASPPPRRPAVLELGPSEELARRASRARAGPVSRLLAAFPCRDGKPRVRWPTLTYVLTPTLYNLQGRQATRAPVHPYLYQAHHLHCTCCAGTASRACAGPSLLIPSAPPALHLLRRDGKPRVCWSIPTYTKHTTSAALAAQGRQAARALVPLFRRGARGLVGGRAWKVHHPLARLCAETPGRPGVPQPP